MSEPLPFHTKKIHKSSAATDVLQPPDPDPLAGVEYTGDLEVDALTELDAIQVAFRDRRRQEERRFKQATDSEFWVAICFESREQKESFLRNAALSDLGDKYLDGTRVAQALGVDLNKEA